VVSYLSSFPYQAAPYGTLALEKFLNRAGSAFDSEGVLAKKLYPNEIAEVELPIDWAMCVVL
jgi:hypothetical protein